MRAVLGMGTAWRLRLCEFSSEVLEEGARRNKVRSGNSQTLIGLFRERGDIQDDLLKLLGC